MSKLLGIDYGRAKIGLAIAETPYAVPLRSINNDGELFATLLKICQSEGITKIVCGIPEGELESEIRIFAKKLEQVTGIAVHLHPETLSTQEAIAKLREVGARRKKLQNDHIYAAALILEDYWEQNSVN